MVERAGPSAAFISVGANIEPLQNIRAALAALQKSARVVSSSTFYRTEPVGRPHQPWFINGVWRIDTDLTASCVKTQLLGPIERQLGRRRTSDKFAARTMDLDLVLYNDLAVNERGLTLPHPDLRRSFVYVPVVELLDDMSSQRGDGLAGRMRALLPESAPPGAPGETLEGFTQQLRDMLCPAIT